MKKRITSIILMLLLVLGTACNIISCSSDDDNEFDPNQFNSASVQKVNRIVNAAEQESATVSESWKDNEGNKYYVIYLGKIELAEIYNIESFYYSGDFEELKLTEENITVTSISNSYRNTVTSTVDWSNKTYIKNSLGIEAGVKHGPFSAGVKDTFETGVEEKLGITFVEEDESIYTTVETNTKRSMKEKTINFKNACTKGKYYRYSVCGDTDCYMNLYVPSDGSDATYQVYTKFDPNRTFTMLLESETHNGFFSNEDFDLTKIDFSELENPTDIKDPHKKLEVSGSYYDTFNVGYDLGILHTSKYLDISSIYKEAIEIGGYSKVNVTASFDMSPFADTWIPRDIKCYLSYSDDVDNSFAEIKKCSLDSSGTISGSLDLKYFDTNQKVYLIFKIPTYAYAGSFNISNVEIHVEIVQ